MHSLEDGIGAAQAQWGIGFLTVRAEAESSVSILFTGIFGALAAYFIVRILSRRISAGAGDGSLAYSSIVLAAGWLLIIFATILAMSMFYGPSAAPDVPRSVAMGVLALAGVFLLFQGVLSRGWFDASGIRFRTPFGGKVDELWRDLRSVHYNGRVGWYVLTFKDGKKIRLSKLLCGYGGVIARLRSLGHHV